METNEIIETKADLVEQDDNGIERQLTQRVEAYSSWKPTTVEDKVKFYNAINSPTKRLSECANTVINLKHVYAEKCYARQEDGSLIPVVRIIFLDEKGEGYCCASQGVFSCVQKLFGIFGPPSVWDKPIPIMPKLIAKGNNRNVLTFEVVNSKK